MTKKRFDIADVGLYLQKASSSETIGKRFIGLAFLASCNKAANIRNPKKRDLRAFYLFSRYMHDAVMSQFDFHGIEQDGGKFFKAVVRQPEHYKLIYREGTMIGEILRYMDRLNPGYAGLGEILEKTIPPSRLEDRGSEQRRGADRYLFGDELMPHNRTRLARQAMQNLMENLK